MLPGPCSTSLESFVLSGPGSLARAERLLFAHHRQWSEQSERERADPNMRRRVSDFERHGCRVVREVKISELPRHDRSRQQYEALQDKQHHPLRVHYNRHGEESQFCMLHGECNHISLTCGKMRDITEADFLQHVFSNPAAVLKVASHRQAERSNRPGRGRQGAQPLGLQQGKGGGRHGWQVPPAGRGFHPSCHPQHYEHGHQPFRPHAAAAAGLGWEHHSAQQDRFYGYNPAAAAAACSRPSMGYGHQQLPDPGVQQHFLGPQAAAPMEAGWESALPPRLAGRVGGVSSSLGCLPARHSASPAAHAAAAMPLPQQVADTGSRSQVAGESSLEAGARMTAVAMASVMPSLLAAATSTVVAAKEKEEKLKYQNRQLQRRIQEMEQTGAQQARELRHVFRDGRPLE